MSVNREIHSVILNLNKNFSNNKGSDFQTIVNRQLELKPNTEVALYGAQLTRPTIVVDKDTDISVEFNSGFLTFEQENLATIATNKMESQSIPLSFTIKKGVYSKSSFCKQFCYQFNKLLTLTEVSSVEPISGQACSEIYPYTCYYRLEGENFYLGLRYTIEQTYNDVGGGVNDEPLIEPYRIGNLDLNDGLSTTSNIAVKDGGRNGQILTFESDSSLNNWNSYFLGNSPVRGMSYTNSDNNPLIESDVAFVSAHIKGHASVYTGNSGFVFGLNNTWLSEKWGNAGATAVGLVNLIDGETPQTQVPQNLIGAYFDVTSDGTSWTNQRVKVYANPRLEQLTNNNLYGAETTRNVVAEEDVRLLGDFDLNEYDVDFGKGSIFRWEVYCRDLMINYTDGNFNTRALDDSVIAKTRRYYFRFMCSNPYYSGQSSVLYDSFQNGIYLHKDVVEGGYMFQQLKSPADPTKQVTGGLCPQFYFNQADKNIVVANPRCNNIASLTSPADGSGLIDNFVINKAVLSQQYGILTGADETKSLNLRKILGLVNSSSFSDGTFGAIGARVSYNPNLFPYIPEEAGFTALSSDLTRYNIEINLPVRAYNNTADKSNDIGQIRTILYNTPPVEANVTNTTQAQQTLVIQPNDVKYLSLNNPEPIKLNSLDIKIRNSNNNEIADEISDCSLELLFRKE